VRRKRLSDGFESCFGKDAAAGGESDEGEGAVHFLEGKGTDEERGSGLGVGGRGGLGVWVGSELKGCGVLWYKEERKRTGQQGRTRRKRRGKEELRIETVYSPPSLIGRNRRRILLLRKRFGREGTRGWRPY
jgi:hypothetical protein